MDTYMSFTPSIVSPIQAFEKALRSEYRGLMSAPTQSADQFDRSEAIRVALIHYGCEELAMRAARTGEIPANLYKTRMAALRNRLSRLEAASR